MERPIFKPVGTRVEKLDTPALAVDLSILERNIESLHAFFRQSAAKVRPHVESHRCPTIAQKQIAAGGTVGGICVTTVGQAEVFVERGFADIFIASEVVTRQKIVRLCALARRARITVAVDNPRNVTDLSEAASASSVTLSAVVDINTRLNRCGVEPGQPAVDLASTVARQPNLGLAGLMTYEGTILAEDHDRLAAESRKCVQKVLDTREMVETAGMEVRVVAAGGTHNYEIVGDMAGVTEVHAGSYALMDGRYLEHRPQFQPAARVMATVTSRPEPGVAITDLGQKAIGADTGLPMADGIAGAAVIGLSAEHGILRLEGNADDQPDLGDKVWLVPWDGGTCANLHDYIHAVRDGRLEAVWEVAARGRYR